MNDIGHERTQEKLEYIENELRIIYKSAMKPLRAELNQINDLLSSAAFKKLNEQEQIANIMRKSEIEKALGGLAQQIKLANNEAMRLIREEFLSVYALNYNYGAFLVETSSGMEVYYELYNKSILKKLLSENENPFTLIAMNDIIDKSMIFRDLKRVFITALVGGESIPQIAERIQGVLDRNFKHAILIARTEITRLQSIGRQDAFDKGTEMGLKLKKKWIATLDSRTRDRHRKLHLKEVDMNDDFARDLAYPGDFRGGAKQVCNCRCTHIVEFVGIERSAALKELDEKIKKMAFDEWRETKK